MLLRRLTYKIKQDLITRPREKKKKKKKKKQKKKKDMVIFITEKGKLLLQLQYKIKGNV